MNAFTAIAAATGRTSIAAASDTGGMVLVLGQSLRRVARGRCDRDELLRSIVSFGLESLPIVLATAAFVGMIMVLQAVSYVRQYGVYDLVGWFTGFTTLREVGPVLIGLMFSGRVGANNTAELATMKVSEQLEALDVLALDVFELLIVPRAFAMIIGLSALVILGDLMAIIAGALCARVLVEVSFTQFVASVVGRVSVDDLSVGVVKALIFGAAIAVVSAHFGLSARGGSSGVGRAVNAQVVAAAVAIFILDYFLTSVVR